MKKVRTGVIGCGNMGEAMLRRLVKNRWPVVASERDSKKRRDISRRRHVKTTADNAGLAARSSVIILAVKPYDVDGVLREISNVESIESKLVISIAAGLTTRRIEGILKSKVPVVRAMPNMPALVGAGVTAISPGRYVKASHIKMAKDILSSIGNVLEVEEGLMDAVTAISGSGPAYFFYLVECIIEAAKGLGLKEEEAKALAIKTAIGSAKVLEEAKYPPQVLREKVTSKGGTTEAAFKIFESRGFKDIVKEAMEAARERAQELSRG